MNAVAQIRPTEFEEEAMDAVDPRDEQARILEAARAIVGRLRRDVDDCVRQRAPIEERWINNLRQYLGKYEPAKFTLYKDAGQSCSFVNITRPKTNGWIARIFDMLFPTDDKNWGIGPTPIPRLTGKAKEAEAAAIAAIEQANQAQDVADQAAQQGNTQAAADVSQQAEQIAAKAGEFAAEVRAHYAAIDEAKRRAEWMERTIEDQLIESDYVAECRDVIEDGCKLGTGILKSPTTVQSLRRQWEEIPAVDDKSQPILDAKTRQPKKAWQMKQDADPRPMSKRVNPWFFYPDMSATRIQDAEFTFELSLPSRKDLKRAARKLGFNRDAVARLLEEGPPQTIDSVLTHLKQIRALTGEDEGISGRYIQWEYNGPLECEEICSLLRAMGREEDARRFETERDPLEEYRVIIWFIGDEVLKIAPEYPLDSGDGLYSVWNFEKSEASIFGIGCPEMLAGRQEDLNNAYRMMLDNGALTVGSQLVFDKGAITPQDGDWRLMPMKVWLRTSTSLHRGPEQAVRRLRHPEPPAGARRPGRDREAVRGRGMLAAGPGAGRAGLVDADAWRHVDPVQFGECRLPPEDQELGRRPHQADDPPRSTTGTCSSTRTRRSRGTCRSMRGDIGAAGPRDPEPEPDGDGELPRQSRDREMAEGRGLAEEDPPDHDDPAARHHADQGRGRES
jgi:hypothetical protein